MNDARILFGRRLFKSTSAPMKKFLILSVSLLLLAGLSVAQQTPYRTCDTDFKWMDALKADPAAAERNAELRKFRNDFISSHRSLTPDGVVLYRIPVVFHVIHTYGSENISKEQILDAMDIINKSFQKLNSDTGMVIPLFQPIFADCQIELVLANIDPAGNCTDGITRTYSPLTASAGDNVKALIGWPSNKYFNVWVVKNIESGAAGYAYYPGISAAIDGVVIRHDYVGGIGTSSGSNYTERSLTHEIGHWLDLPHTWGSTNSPGLASNCNTDDGIADTPNTIGTDDFSCNTAQSTCGAIDNVQNYMDYASCHYMFTEGQKMAMHAALNSPVGSRNNLWQISNLLSTGTESGRVVQTCAPIADFNVQKYYICQGGTVYFKDASWGGEVTSRTWQFPGGTPATDTSATPAVSFALPGVYDVTLTVSNAAGNDMITRNGIVEVFPYPGTNPAPYAESFETITFPGGEWSVENTGTSNAWSLSSLAGATGTKSLRLTNQSGNPSGNIDAVITPTLNLTGVNGAQVSFKYAFASKNNSDSSMLRVFVSTNCGSSWQMRYSFKGAALRTAPNTNGNFVPSSTQWNTQVVNLPNASNKPSVRVKFEFTNVNGNNIYLDDINVSSATGINEVLARQYEFEAYPNPAHARMKVTLHVEKPSSVQLEILDVNGRLQKYLDLGTRAGDVQQELEGSGMEGVYLLRITVNDQQFTRRIAFIR